MRSIWRELSIFIISTLIGYFINVFSAVTPISPWVAGIGILAGSVIVLFLNFTRPSQTSVGDHNQIILRSPREENEKAKEGLVVVLPLYPAPCDAEEKRRFIDRVKAGDYQALDFTKTNFAHVVRAIEINQGKLKHCWILSTASTDGAIGSDVYLDCFIDYIKTEKRIQCEFHTDFRIETVDDSSITEKTLGYLDMIFKSLKKLGLKENQIRVDCTGGPRSMTLGIFLACLDSQRDIQFMGTRYDETGRPTGALFPMVTHFQVRTNNKE